MSVMRRTAEHPTLDERFLVTGLKDATVTLRPPIGARVRVVRAEKSHVTDQSSEVMTVSDDGRTVTVSHLTGNFYFAWQSDHNPGCILKKLTCMNNGKTIDVPDFRVAKTYDDQEIRI